jgi:hypothetical protein
MIRTGHPKDPFVHLSASYEDKGSRLRPLPRGILEQLDKFPQMGKALSY